MEIIVVVLLILVVCGVVSFGTAAAFVGKIILWSAVAGIAIMIFAALSHSGRDSGE